MSKTPDQSIYDYLKRIGEKSGEKVYIFNPPAGTAYPFIQLGSIQIIPTATKSRLIGKAYATVDVWGDRNNRKIVSDLATYILEQAGRYSSTDEGLQIMLDQNESSIEIMTDASTNDPLWRARISLAFKFY